MALQGPFVVVADNPTADVVEALRAAGAFPVVESSWAEAAAAIAAVAPEALVLASPCADAATASAYVDAIERELTERRGPFMPVVARIDDDGALPIEDALTVSAQLPASDIARRLSAALRIRALHATVLGRIETLNTRGEAVPAMPDDDPLDEATVLVAGRGRSYPELAVAVGERVGLVGALSVETAARALNARDIEGVVIGDGFSSRVVAALLTVLSEDVRFRDLPIAVLGADHGVVEEFYGHLPNLDHVIEGPIRLIDRFLPFVRLYAFGQRCSRMLKTLDSKGLVDPETGLLARQAFWDDLARAVGDAEKRGIGLSIARFSFGNRERRISLDAARLIGRLMRQVDFACRDADDSIFAVFTETDLRAAHVIARRIASVLKHTMVEPHRRSGIETAVTLATLRPSDSVDSLMARVGDIAAG